MRVTQHKSTEYPITQNTIQILLSPNRMNLKTICEFVWPKEVKCRKEEKEENNRSEAIDNFGKTNEVMTILLKFIHISLALPKNGPKTKKVIGSKRHKA